MIIMIDTETTSLSAFNGVAHQLAYHAILPNFSAASGVRWGIWQTVRRVRRVQELMIADTCSKKWAR